MVTGSSPSELVMTARCTPPLPGEMEPRGRFSQGGTGQLEAAGGGPGTRTFVPHTKRDLCLSPSSGASSPAPAPTPLPSREALWGPARQPQRSSLQMRGGGGFARPHTSGREKPGLPPPACLHAFRPGTLRARVPRGKEHVFGKQLLATNLVPPPFAVPTDPEAPLKMLEDRHPLCPPGAGAGPPGPRRGRRALGGSPLAQASAPGRKRPPTLSDDEGWGQEAATVAHGSVTGPHGSQAGEAAPREGCAHCSAPQQGRQAPRDSCWVSRPSPRRPALRQTPPRPPPADPLPSTASTGAFLFPAPDTPVSHMRRRGCHM